MSWIVHHGDCLEILPTLGKVDAVVTDVDAVVTDLYSRGMNTQQAGNKARCELAASAWKQREADIRRMYFEERKSQQEIADHYGVSLGGIQKAMKRLGIASRPRSRSGSENGRYKHGRASTAYRLIVEKLMCENCGTNSDLCVHHRNGDHLDNTRSNLAVLCMSCHSRHHKQAWWNAQART